MPGPPPWAQYGQPTGALGTMRPTGMTMLLFFVTLGIWGFVYYFQTQEEMKRHTGEGLGGVLALVIAVFFGIVSPFFLSHEVGRLYERRGQAPPVTALTAPLVLPGHLHPRRPVHLVRADQQGAQRVLAQPGRHPHQLV